MADEFQATLVRLGKGGEVKPPGEGWELVTTCASLAPGSVWFTWRLPKPRRTSCPECQAVSKRDPDKVSPCTGCGTEW